MKDDLDDFLGLTTTKKTASDRRGRLESFTRDALRARVSGNKATDMIGLRAVLSVKDTVEEKAADYQVYEIMPLVYTSDKTVSGQFKVTWMDGDIEWMNFNIILKPTVKISVRFE